MQTQEDRLLHRPNMAQLDDSRYKDIRAMAFLEAAKEAIFLSETWGTHEDWTQAKPQGFLLKEVRQPSTPEATPEATPEVVTIETPTQVKEPATPTPPKPFLWGNTATPPEGLVLPESASTRKAPTVADWDVKYVPVGGKVVLP